ncbi:RsmB/NOP family class I SAM-dependent RNA methyltransferase [Rhizobium sp. SSA_523]|uniref:RsmB/NOP family class I SAM-dependent RNA methyltransferase n=1 Tax=Rhizobium sp. SSA_523 TaxID=2952477 RepID=UPI0020914675|nr:RsmB/NOP family class I SAM-dependent RNA methyltransferase [Rhizobium sp. SSA_523]MCO5734566.1 MFS transporter [Rhizobium sp. SSA_523]WKC23348.1 RsmB/NOP family class I SAM-dependent RNA methyltransferase [Rhizobium sp. SSA_523]
MADNKKTKNKKTPGRVTEKAQPGGNNPFAPKPGLEVRAAAAKILAAVIDKKTSLDGMLDAVHGNAAYAALGDADRSLTRAILNATLRHLPRIDHAIATLLDSPLPDGARALQQVLRVAATQILYLDVPAHAAVDLAVEQANRDPRNRRFAKLVNAVLRRMVREREDILQAGQAISPVPDWYRDRLTRAYGEAEARRIAEAQLSPAPIDITVKGDAALWAERLSARPLPTGSLRLKAFDGSVTQLPGFDEGAWWVQDAAAALPAQLFGPLQGKRIADLCAAPGGKTAQLISRGAKVIAVEQSANRAARLKENLDRLQLTADICNIDLFDYKPDEPLDGVLLDAPCSSTGTTRRHPDVLWTKGPQDIEKLAGLQARMLRHAITLVRPGGLIVFSNCSLDPLEGEDLVQDLLDEDHSVERVAINAADWPGLESAVNARGEFRTTPAMLPASEEHAGGMDGFFACVLRRR